MAARAHVARWTRPARRAVRRWQAARSATARELRRLEQEAPYTPGVTAITGSPVRYLHPQPIAKLYDTIFRLGAYHFETPRPDPTIFDCGANVGIASLYWKKLYPSARITAFEADPRLATILSENFTAAGWSDVQVVAAAVWTSSGTASFRGEGGDAGRLGEGDLRVPTVRLRDYLESSDSIDLLKLDIEGAEVDVLEDCGDRLAGIERIFVEFHSMVGKPQRLDSLVAVLARAGYRLNIQPEFFAKRPFVSRPEDHGMDLRLNIYAFRP
jgi:FkbM family methyltransferase